MQNRKTHFVILAIALAISGTKLASAAETVRLAANEGSGIVYEHDGDLVTSKVEPNPGSDDIIVVIERANANQGWKSVELSLAGNGGFEKFCEAQARDGRLSAAGVFTYSGATPQLKIGVVKAGFLNNGRGVFDLLIDRETYKGKRITIKFEHD